MPAAITAVGKYVPDYILTNAALAELCNTDDTWIQERTGISERRILNDGRASSDMAVEALQNALAKRGVAASEIDLVICATVTPDMVFPATANVVCDKIGATKAFGFDLNAACSGFLYALCTGAQFIQNAKYQRVAVIGVDKMSSIIDFQDRNTAVLFGDGAGAVLLEAQPTEGLQDFVLRSDGSGRKYLYMKAGGSARPASIDTVLGHEHYVVQEGKPVFKAAVEQMSSICVELMERNQLLPHDIRYLVPHQANRRIIEATAERMGVGMDKVVLNIHKYGNTTAATIPLALADIEDKLKVGDKLVLTAFGGGFTWGAAYLSWAI